MAHLMESEYMMIDTFTESQPADGAEEVTDAATVRSPRLNQEADAASTALRHAQKEAASPFLASRSLWKTWTGPNPGSHPAHG